jgi:hypothetical protein
MAIWAGTDISIHQYRKAVGPHVDDARFNKAIHKCGKALTSRREKLRPMVDTRAGVATGCHPATNPPRLINDQNGLASPR